MPQGPHWQSMYRALAALLVIIGTLAGFARWQIDDPAWRSRILLAVARATGMSATARGKITLAVFPTPRIAFEAASLARPDGTLRITSAGLECVFALLPLIGSRFEIASLSLDHAVIHATVPQDALQDSGTVARASLVAAAIAADQAGSHRFSQLTLGNSTMLLQLAGTANAVSLSGVNVKLDWPYADAPASFAGEAKWLGSKADIAGFVARPQDLQRGGESPLTLRVTSPALSIKLAGVAQGGRAPGFKGRMEGASRALLAQRQGADATGNAIAGRDTPNSVIEADMSLSGAGVELAALRVWLGRSLLEGSLNIGYRQAGASMPRLAVAGSLAAADLELAPLGRALPAALDSQNHWSSAGFDLDWVQDTDIDLRVSAVHASLGALRGDDLAVSLHASGGRFDLALNELQAYGGRAKASLTGIVRQSRLEAAIEAGFAGIDFARLAQDEPGLARVSGLAQGNARGTSSGNSFVALVHNLAGKTDIALSDGKILGLDFERALRRLERKPGILPLSLDSGDTVFTSLKLETGIASGVAQITSGILQGPGIQAEISGDIDIEHLRVGVSSRATLNTPSGEPGTGRPILAIDFNGSVGRLAVSPRLSGSAVQPVSFP